MTLNRLSLLIAVCGLCPGASPANATTDLHNVLVDYTLTSWAEKDGLESTVIWAIAQDSQGYLWLGTDAGPVRFDGARFRGWESLGLPSLPKLSVHALYAGRDGSLWFGFGDAGGVSRLHDDHLQNYGVSDGLPEGAITVLLEDRNGTLLAGNGHGLYALVSDRWESAGDGLSPGSVLGAFVDKAGRLMVGTASGAYARAPGQHTFSRAEAVVDVVRDIEQDRSGAIWVTDPIVAFRRLDERRASIESPEQGRGNRLLHDSAGNLWVGTSRQGLWRVRFDDPSQVPLIEKTTALTGFSDNGVTSLYEDAEGNLWAGTLDGLNRLSPHKITPVTDLGLVSGVEKTVDGSVWVGTVDGVVRFPQGSFRLPRHRETLPGLLSAMHADSAGRLWVAAGPQLLVFEGGARRTVSFSGPRQPRQINALTSDPSGGLWISDIERGLLRWDGGRLQPFNLPTDLAKSRLVTIQSHGSGNIWLAFENGRAAVIDPHRTIKTFGREDGLDAGALRLIYEDHTGALWFGGAEGLSRFVDGSFSTWRTSKGFPSKSITAIVEDEGGTFWLGTEGSGIVRVGRAELEAAIADPARRPRYRLFDKADGLAGTARWFGNRGAVRTHDGRVWFVAGRGITVLDPRALPETAASPVRVRVEGVVADDERIPALAHTILPAGTTRVQIDYSVLNLTSSYKTHFRYQLAGFDSEWIEAGSRRQAFYTNLAPHDYEFRVVASNDDGTWGESVGTWSFAVQPMFYQSAWFFVVCVLVLSAIIGAAWRLHVNRVRGEFALLLGERARLSREIHDTLLQGLFGVALRCDAIADSLDSTAPRLKEQFLQMRKDVQEYIQEARQSVQDLRSPWLVGHDLSVALREAGQRATTGTPVKFEFVLRGTPRGCAGNVEQQLLRICQEAVANAVRHADAREIRLELEYDDTRATLRVKDDGRGFDPHAVRAMNGHHYGLISMQERAASVGGILELESAPGQGAEVRAILPI